MEKLIYIYTPTSFLMISPTQRRQEAIDLIPKIVSKKGKVDKLQLAAHLSLQNLFTIKKNIEIIDTLVTAGVIKETEGVLSKSVGRKNLQA